MLPRRSSRTTSTLVACALAALLASCGGSDEPRDATMRSERLTVYSSQPQRGPERAVAADVLRAEQLALAWQGGRIGRYRVRLLPLDASTLRSGRTEPSQISENARRAARNPTTIAYLGELETGTSAISIPLLNEEGILEVSPLDTSMALTTGSAAVTGSPQRFYPKQGEVGRTFARVAPSDRSQADALIAYMHREHVFRLALLTGDDLSGLALAQRVRARARESGITVVAREQIDVHALEQSDLAERVALARPDAVLDAGGARPETARLWGELLAAAPQLKLFGPAALADPSFAAALGSIESSAYLTRPVLGPEDDPPAARRFEEGFEREYGHPPAPEARYGYEAMRGVLAAIARAEASSPDGDISRADVVDEYFDTRRRDGALGRYLIEPTGDSSLVRWGAFRVVDGRLGYAGPLLDGSADASIKR